MFAANWQECINEFIVRAITVYLASNESTALGSQVYEKEKSRGVSDLDPLLTALQEYADNRAHFPNFDSYCLKVLEVFRKYLAFGETASPTFERELRVRCAATP